MKKVLCLLSLLFVVCLVGCKKNQEKVITVGASVAPHAEILEQCKEYVKSKGYELKIVVYNDYVLPNIGVNDGSLDANYFQHKPYLDTFNVENKTDLVSVKIVHYEPLGIYAGKKDSLEKITTGSTIAIPNDSSNRARALYFLESLGYIKLDQSKGVLVTSKDILENALELKIVELEAAQIPLQLPSFDFGVVNGNYALSAKITDKILGSEDSESIGATVYGNIICVKAGKEESEKTKILVEAISQENIKEFINKTYNNIVVPLI